MPREPIQPDAHDESDSDELVSVGTFLPGGKVDPEAIRRAVEESQEEDDDSLRTVVFTLRKDLNKRLDKYLTDRITFMSRTQLQRLIDEGGVTVNNRPPKSSTKLNAGDVVKVIVPPPPAKGTIPEDIPLDVLFEDEHLIVLNKQPDFIVHPARSHLGGTMINALAYHFKHRSTLGGALSTVGDEFARPGVVHRLDRHTSGVIVFAKNDEAHWKLGRQFEQRQVDKRYLAITHGHITPPADVIEFPIGPHPSREKGYREKYVVRHDDLGKHAITIARVREYYGTSDATLAGPAPAVAPGWSGATPPTVPAPGLPPGHQRVPSIERPQFSLVELELKTGRTHQIRVHLSHLGFPIVGDDMYGGRNYVNAKGETVIARQALHATLLGFTHPMTNKPLLFTAPLRGDMASLVAHLRALPDRETPNIPGATVDLKWATGE